MISTGVWTCVTRNIYRQCIAVDIIVRCALRVCCFLLFFFKCSHYCHGWRHDWISRTKSINVISRECHLLWILFFEKYPAYYIIHCALSKPRSIEHCFGVITSHNGVFCFVANVLNSNVSQIIYLSDILVRNFTHAKRDISVFREIFNENGPLYIPSALHHLCNFCLPITMDFYNDDVIKSKHFPRYWPFVRGIHRSPVNYPQKSRWHGAFIFFLSAPEWTVEQTIARLVIQDNIAPIMMQPDNTNGMWDRSLLVTLHYGYLLITQDTITAYFRYIV